MFFIKCNKHLFCFLMFWDTDRGKLLFPARKDIFIGKLEFNTGDKTLQSSIKSSFCKEKFRPEFFSKEVQEEQQK